MSCVCCTCTPLLLLCNLTYLRHLIRSEGSQGRACPPSERQTGRGEVMCRKYRLLVLLFISLVSSLYSAECLCLVCTGVPVPPLAFCDLTYLRHLIRSEGSQGRACPPSERQTGRGEVQTDSPPKTKPLPNTESNLSLSLTRRAKSPFLTRRTNNKSLPNQESDRASP